MNSLPFYIVKAYVKFKACASNAVSISVTDSPMFLIQFKILILFLSPFFLTKGFMQISFKFQIFEDFFHRLFFYCFIFDFILVREYMSQCETVV